MLDYTEDTGLIVRGGRWPPAGGSIAVVLTRTENAIAANWPAGVLGWAWQLLISRNQYGGTPDLILNACAVTLLAANILEVRFAATSAETATLPETNRRGYYVYVRSTSGATLGYYAYGMADIESAVGEV